LAAVAIEGMVLGYCHKKTIVAIKCAIATIMWEVATFFPLQNSIHATVWFVEIA
jgi:hypothetical protein